MFGIIIAAPNELVYYNLVGGHTLYFRRLQIISIIPISNGINIIIVICVFVDFPNQNLKS
ncbi:hypothetical protein A2468_04155 [Candidatus Falkowbacteria bacterium RIFOXYC2_FULL_46_15]|uniref:Uncharacterized protein n=1 Tax=Candidatus Falkowbacteria bacterium RIFOXYA2_FULL_47_19 TaxID=1797994 RepID=A0A1F5SNH3_9BACT|nr:MAG: hypothetical protein A2227_05305 [Candidatus Falkowbacteria bacterium RIFOXYA2_FULL_47_19]OGF35148.1 MAG: hypothetical protein A2468_04155 [Candidatus Falkowbacteria bacterium RIFOXYC2_FULL_46_15]